MTVVKRLLWWYPGRRRTLSIVDLQKRESKQAVKEGTEVGEKGSCEQLCNGLLEMCGYQIREWMLHEENVLSCL